MFTKKRFTCTMMVLALASTMAAPAMAADLDNKPINTSASSVSDEANTDDSIQQYLTIDEDTFYANFESYLSLHPMHSDNNSVDVINLRD